MFNVSRWSILVLSIFSIALAGCGSDSDDDDKGAAGSGGEDGTAGTGGEDGTAGTGGEDGEGDEYIPNCTALCDNVYSCGGFTGIPTVEACYEVCEGGEIEPTWMECFETTEACEELPACSVTCEDAAVDVCTDEGGTCEDANFEVFNCAIGNGCTDLFTFFDEACFDQHCSAEDAAYVSCIENDCEEFLACQD